VEEREGRAGPGDATHQAKVDPPPTEGGAAMLKRKHVLRGGIDGERRVATARGIRGRRRGGAERPDPPPRAHGGEHGGCTGWGDDGENTGWGDDMRGEGGGEEEERGTGRATGEGRVRVWGY
jgi:hypothetical protein